MDIKFYKKDKYYTISINHEFKNTMFLKNTNDKEGMGISEEVIFELLDKYFKENF